jgi:hypothetical protein
VTTEERDAIKVGDTVTFDYMRQGKSHTGEVIHAGLCGLDVRVKDEIYNVYRSEVIKVKTKEVEKKVMSFLPDGREIDYQNDGN